MKRVHDGTIGVAGHVRGTALSCLALFTSRHYVTLAEYTLPNLLLLLMYGLCHELLEDPLRVLPLMPRRILILLVLLF